MLLENVKTFIKSFVYAFLYVFYILFSRYIHSILVPILIFIVHKDLRKKAEIIICCWRPNSVENKKSSLEARPISAYLHRKRRDWEKKQKKFKNVTNFNVPVLFASSDGLYLRLVDDTAFNPNEDASDILSDSIKAQWSVEPKFVMEMCDLTLPMSASRGRVLTSTSEAEAAVPNFGTTVTVIVNNQDHQLKSSLKKPRPSRSSPEEDEGFIDEVLAEPKKVQFKTQILEIPLKEDPAKAQSSPKRSQKTVLPPLPHSENGSGSPAKKNSRKSRHNNRRYSDDSPRRKVTFER